MDTALFSDPPCTGTDDAGDAFLGTWGAHRFFLQFSTDGSGTSSFGVEYTRDSGELREDTEFTWVFSDDRRTVTATVTSVLNAVYYGDGRPPVQAGEVDYGPAVGDVIAYEFCRPHVLLVRAVHATHSTEPGFGHLCRSGADPWVCGA